MTPQEAILQAKIGLTAALRTAAWLGLHEGVCNHFSYAIPGDYATELFLITPQGVHWSDMFPSDIVTVGVDGNRIDGHRQVETTAFFIHGRVHRAKPTARCIMHTHMPYATALTMLRDGKLEWASQNSLRFYGRLAYDNVYNGLALDEAEGNRICARLEDADILFMANHGILLCGDTIANVFDATAKQFDQERQQSYLHFDALKRRLDATSPGWSATAESSTGLSS